MAASSGSVTTGTTNASNSSANIASVISSSGGSLQATEMYSLKWNAYESHLTAGLAKLLNDQEFADVTLACDGQFIQAHKMLLSLCSPYFKRMFQVNKAQHNANTIVILNNVEFHNLESIIQFIYNGEVNVKNADFANFLHTGEMLQIEGLSGASANSQDGDGSGCAKQPQQIRKGSPSVGPSMSVRTTIKSETPTPNRVRDGSPKITRQHSVRDNQNVRTSTAAELSNRNLTLSTRNGAKPIILPDEPDPLDTNAPPLLGTIDVDPLRINGMEVFETGNSGDSFESSDHTPLSEGYQTYEPSQLGYDRYDGHGSNQDDEEEYVEMPESAGLFGASANTQHQVRGRPDYRQRSGLEFTTAPYRVPEQRRKSSALWDYFLYDTDLDLVQCQLTRSGHPCHFHARHKPLSNMKYHIRTVHPREYEIILPRLLNRN